MVKVKYISACLDSSGYAQAARANIAALHQVGVDVSVQAVSFESFKSDLGKHGNLIKSLAAHENEPVDIQLVHMTPQYFPQSYRKDCYNIGYTTWETSRLPDDWISMINTMDEIWVPSEHNVEMFKRSGITKPIMCVPHAFDKVSPVLNDLELENLTGSEFVFYSIFQWLERKNPVGLITAYCTEFQNDEDVALVLKTYRQNPGNEAETTQLREDIKLIKQHLWLPKYPKMLLVSKLMSTEEINCLHKTGDSLVSLTRCEGFGIPIAEAMRAGNSVVTTNYGGPVDFVDHGKTGFLVDQTQTPVYGMPWNMYKGNMDWAQPDVLHARKCMRKLYEDRKLQKEMGNAAQEWVGKNLSLETIGQLMKSRLETIKEQR